jgi:hypothetical protein
VRKLHDRSRRSDQRRGSPEKMRGDGGAPFDTPCKNAAACRRTPRNGAPSGDDTPCRRHEAAQPRQQPRDRARRRHCDDCARKRVARPSPARPQRADFRAFRDAAAARGVRRRRKFARQRRQEPRVCAGFGAATACRRARPPKPADFRASGDTMAGALRHASQCAAARRQMRQDSAQFGNATACRRRKTAQERGDGRERRQRRERRGNGDRAGHGGGLRRCSPPVSPASVARWRAD